MQPKRRKLNVVDTKTNEPSLKGLDISDSVIQKELALKKLLEIRGKLGKGWKSKKSSVEILSEMRR